MRKYYQACKQWWLALLLPMTYGGVYIPFPEEMQKFEYPIAEVIYWLMQNCGVQGKDYRLYNIMAGFPAGVRILDREVATMFKLKFKL